MSSQNTIYKLYIYLVTLNTYFSSVIAQNYIISFFIWYFTTPKQKHDFNKPKIIIRWNKKKCIKICAVRKIRLYTFDCDLSRSKFTFFISNDLSSCVYYGFVYL